jgi:uncharacterized protein (TIGR02284 family)
MQDYSAIKDVVAVCRDAEQGFRGAANAVKSPPLKRLFEEYSAERGQFATELLHVARGMGMDIDDSSGITGVLHAGWMELRGAVSRHDEHQILVEAERGEDYSVRTYREALGLNVSEGIRTILESQFTKVQQAHDRIRSLRDSTARKVKGQGRQEAGAGGQEPGAGEAMR